MSSPTWARTLSMCAPIARRSIATTPRWPPTRRTHRNANCTTLLIANNREQRFSAPSSNRVDQRRIIRIRLRAITRFDTGQACRVA